MPTPEQAEAVLRIDEAFPVRDLEQVIRYPMTRDLMLKGPPDVAADQRACGHARADPC